MLPTMESSPQPTVACPKCGTPVPLTEALAAPLLEATRVEYENKLQAKDAVFAKQEDELKQKETAARELAQQLEKREAELNRKSQDARAEIDRQREQLAAEVARQTEAAVTKQLAERLAIEKKTIAEDEERRANQRFADELAERERDSNDKAERIEKLLARLAVAQNAEAELKRRERDFEDREREMTLKIEQEVSGQLDQVRAVAATEAEQRLSLQLSDKDRTIRELATKLEEASRKAQQGSQQAQGETLELVLEEQLRRQFPFDEFQPVPKGEFGGDTLHIVRDGSGRECGRILWEFKRTKVWQAVWLPKLKADQRAARADLAVIVSQAMPSDVQHFNEVDGVWISSLGCTLPVATALRATLLQLAGQRRNADGQQTKSALVYTYLTGPQFRGRIEAIAERWSEMQKDLADEKKATMKRWSKRESQLHTLIESTAGIYGDLQGIAGRDLAEIQALGETLLLES
ncbi:MAG: DUF2130 domain-containing protein [Acidobacteriaceae bacterium]